MSPRPPPKISLRHDLTKELGSKVDQQPEGKVVQQPEGETVRQPEGETVRQPEGETVRQTKFFQSVQPTTNPIRDSSGRPGIMQGVIGVQDERKTPPFSRNQCEFF